MKENLKLKDMDLEGVSGGSNLPHGKEVIRYGAVDCPNCESSNTEAHYINGRISHLKCFDCGFENIC